MKSADRFKEFLHSIGIKSAADIPDRAITPPFEEKRAIFDACVFGERSMSGFARENNMTGEKVRLNIHRTWRRLERMHIEDAINNPFTVADLQKKIDAMREGKDGRVRITHEEMRFLRDVLKGKGLTVQIVHSLIRNDIYTEKDINRLMRLPDHEEWLLRRSNGLGKVSMRQLYEFCKLYVPDKYQKNRRTLSVIVSEWQNEKLDAEKAMQEIAIRYSLEAR